MSDRLLAVLERNRAELAANLSAETVRELAEIEERNQFDDDRRKTLSELRGVFERVVREQTLKEQA